MTKDKTLINIMYASLGREGESKRGELIFPNCYAEIEMHNYKMSFLRAVLKSYQV